MGAPRYDCILMLSGGKDSTYLAHLLEQQKKRPLAITVDVGFMSDYAKENIERVKDKLHLDHLWVKSQPAAHAKVIDQFRSDQSMGLSDVCGSCTLLTMRTVLAIANDLSVKHLFCGFTKHSAFTSTKQSQVKLPGGFVYENPFIQDYNLPRIEEFLSMLGFVTDPTMTNCDHIREIIIRHTNRFGANPYEEEFKSLLDSGQIDEKEVDRLRSWCSPAFPQEFPEEPTTMERKTRIRNQTNLPTGFREDQLKMGSGDLWMRT
jgi:hypothetical protein